MESMNSQPKHGTSYNKQSEILDLCTQMLYSSTLSVLRVFCKERGFTICILGYVKYDLNSCFSKPPNFMQWVD